MKQKDFDFIQHKFEQAQPPLPDGLRAECLKQRILKKESHKVIAMPKRTSRYKAWAVTAAGNGVCGCCGRRCKLVRRAGGRISKRGPVNGCDRCDDPCGYRRGRLRRGHNGFD